MLELLRSVGPSLIRIGIGVGLLIAIALCLVFYFQERLIFFPEPLPLDFQFRFAGSFEEKWIEMPGSRVHSLYFRQTNPKRLILYFHGNAGSLAGWGEVAAELANRTQSDVWIIDYPGYGKSSGGIRSEAQLQQLAQILWKHAQPLGLPIVIFGRSIGTGPAVALASTTEAKAVILETPFLSLVSMAQLHYRFVPTFLLRYQFRSDLAFENIRSPILILHGTEDEIIPLSQGEELAKLNVRARVVRIQGGHHNDLDQSPDYWRGLQEFLNSI